MPDDGRMFFSAGSLDVARSLVDGLARDAKEQALAIARRDGRTTVTVADMISAFREVVSARPIDPPEE